MNHLVAGVHHPSRVHAQAPKDWMSKETFA
jgi:hypothetical protein